MIQVIPKWEIRWRYTTDKDAVHHFIISAWNTMECATWFNHINHGLKIVDYVQFSMYKEPELIYNKETK